MDMSIGVLIAFRRTAAFGLIAGIVVSLGYMVGAAILTPDLWIEPLGALVKTGPADRADAGGAAGYVAFSAKWNRFA